MKRREVMMYHAHIRGPPGDLMKQMLRRIAHFLLSFHFDLIDIRRTFMTIRPLSTILAELSTLIQALADQHVPPIPFDEELAMTNRVLLHGNDSLVFRAIEVFVLSAHASGLTQDPALQHTSAYMEAVQVLRMSGRDLPADL
jgi:hypothetical protein